MTLLYCLSIDSSFSLEKAWSAFERKGIEILYGSTEEGEIQIFAYLSSIELLKSFPWVTACKTYDLPPIDWQSQWAIHSHHFCEGYAHIDFASFGRPGFHIRLQPGSGFGDLSHPTTRLMIHMLVRHLHQQTVIDIGCGSGILSLAATVLGAPLAYGIDIDVQSLEHAHHNALLNHLETQCIFSLPSHFTWQHSSQQVLILMNMIRTEQLDAWSSLPSLHPQAAKLLTSGIRAEERNMYLDQMLHLGWSLKEEQEEEGWLAFYLLRE